MKKSINLIGTIVLYMVWSLGFSQGITVPNAASPKATVSQMIGISQVTISYSRPAVKGRAIWGQLVPFGWNVQGFGARNSAPWRAGANENTVIEITHPVKVEGVQVPAGAYGLFFVINANNSGEVILSRDSQSWGSFWYDANNDQMRAKIQIRDVTHTELLTYDFINLSKNTGDLVLNWEKKQFPVRLEFETDEIVMANAREELKGPVGFTHQGYTSAANYALANNVNHEQAVKWIDQAITQNRSFNTLRIKAGLLKQTGKTDEASKLLAAAYPLATEVELNNYGYQLIAQGDHEEAIRILTINTDKFPKSANAWDSLGEAYATKGDKPNAIKSFKKSLTLNPPENVRLNSEMFLKRFGAM